MTDETGQETLRRQAPRTSARKRRRRRWLLVSVPALVVIVVLSVGAFIELQPTPAPLALPTEAASPPVGPLAEPRECRDAQDVLQVSQAPES